jgi:putative acetyltransferase
VHAFDLERLRAPGVTFWSAWAGGELLGCGALHEIDPRSGEIKSMRTAPAHRGKGVGSRILEHLIAVARQRGYARLLLETGAMPEFAPARALYRRYGFEYRGPFADYREDPNSVYMEKWLDEREA